MSIPSDPEARLRQNQFIDAIVAGKIPSPRVTSTASYSLKPGPELAFGCACNNQTALALAAVWRFAEPVTRMPADEFDELVNRNPVVFTGLLREAR